MLFDWLVTGQIVPVSPAARLRGPRHVVKVSKTPVLDPTEARTLLDSIDVTTPAGLRNRALIGFDGLFHRAYRRGDCQPETWANDAARRKETHVPFRA